MQPAIAHGRLTIARPAHLVMLARLGTLARRKPVGALAVTFVLITVVAALLADVLTVHTPVWIDARMRLIGPGAIARDGGIYLLGGDELGRDLFARVLHGARVSLAVGLVAVGIGTITGTVLGLTSGYFMGKVDLVIQRVEDAQQAIPSLLLAMLLVSVFPPSLWVVTAAVGITQVPRVNRVVRGAVLSIKQNAYMDAARAIGCRTPNVLWRHLLPNVLPNIIIIATTSLGGAIITEASLSFLGFGVPPPTPSWGGMISSGGREYMFDNPMLLFVPAVALSITVLSFNLAGDALRDLLDPKLRGR